MKYSNPNNTGKSIIHQFSKEGEHYIGNKRWGNIDMSFREIKTNSDKRKFGFTIRYGNPKDKEWKLNQFEMNEDEIKQFLDIVYETVYSPPKFKSEYEVGDRFIIPDIKVLSNIGECLKEVKYTNVESKIISKYTNANIQYYVLWFDGQTIVKTREYIDSLKTV